MSNFSQNTTDKLNNDNTDHMKDYFVEAKKLLGTEKVSFEKFESSVEQNTENLASISSVGDGMKFIVNEMSELSKIDGTKRSETLNGRDRLADVVKEIQKSNKLSDGQRKLLLDQASLLRAGLNAQNNITSTIKKSLADYSDAAVAGFTSVLGNSPIVLFTSKLLVDQVKGFSARRKERKEAKAQLAKQVATENKNVEIAEKAEQERIVSVAEQEKQSVLLEKIESKGSLSSVAEQEKQSSSDINSEFTSASIASQKAEENRREEKKKTTANKAEGKEKTKKEGILGLIGGLAHALGGVTGLFASLIPTLGVLTTGGLLKKFVSGIAKVGPAAGVAAAAFVGFKIGSWIQDTWGPQITKGIHDVFHNDDVTEKTAQQEAGAGEKTGNFLDEMFTGQIIHTKRESLRQQTNGAKNSGFDSFEEMKKYNQATLKRKNEGREMTATEQKAEDERKARSASRKSNTKEITDYMKSKGSKEDVSYMSEKRRTEVKLEMSRKGYEFKDTKKVSIGKVENIIVGDPLFFSSRKNPDTGSSVAGQMKELRELQGIKESRSAHSNFVQNTSTNISNNSTNVLPNSSPVNQNPSFIKSSNAGSI